MSGMNRAPTLEYYPLSTRTTIKKAVTDAEPGAHGAFLSSEQREGAQRGFDSFRKAMLMRGFPALMYHKIESDECPVVKAEEKRYAVGLDEFVRQLDLIAASRQRCPALSRAAVMLAQGESPSSITLITFDDGNRSDSIHALPALVQRGLIATFFVTIERFGKADGVDAGMIRELYAAGMEIGSHGLTHRFLTLLSDDEVRRELEVSRDVLSEVTGSEVKSFAPPGGRVDDRVAALARQCGYEFVCTSRVGFNEDARRREGLKRFPVTAAMAERSFRAIIERKVGPLVPIYLRYHALRLARKMFGESFYGASRSRIVGGTR